jgi:hypothetical protein
LVASVIILDWKYCGSTLQCVYHKLKESYKKLDVLTQKLEIAKNQLETSQTFLEDKRRTTILGENVYQNAKVESYKLISYIVEVQKEASGLEKEKNAIISL